MTRSTAKLVRIVLGILLLLVAINAFAGGYYGMAGAKDIPVEWLEGSPFKDYFIPSLFLFLIIGGFALLSAIAVFSSHPRGRSASIITGIIICIWLGIQVAIIGYISWMQPVTATAALIMIILASILPSHDAKSAT